uniref:reverse transcriptase domain-containing protein n=1 Tax=Candidatus Thiosymbion oneisti TaxID=589554 RepID=UPI000B022B02
PLMEEPKARHQRPRKVKRRVGSPQGGVISPLLANLYLHWMDNRFHDREGPAQRVGARLVGDADDLIILARHQGKCLGDWVEATAQGWMGLEIKRGKTRTIRLTETGARVD